MNLRMYAAAVCACLIAGCGPKKPPFDGPTVDSFTGHLVQNSKPVTFPDGEKVVLNLVFQEKAQQFGIPIQPDGGFKIGWMPIGKYSAVLSRTGSGGKGAPKQYSLPEGFTITQGQTEYVVELGKGYKP